MADNSQEGVSQIQGASRARWGGKKISIVRRAAANTGFVLIGQILTKAVSVVVVLYLASYLGKEGFGKFNLAFAYLLFFAVITDFGLDQVMVRELSAREGDKPALLGNAIVLKMVMAVLSITIAIGILPFFDYPSSTKLLIIVAAASLIFSLQAPSFGTVFTVVYTAELERVYVAAVDIVIRVIVSVAVLVMALAGRPLVELVALNAFGLAPGFLVMGYMSMKKLHPVFKLDLAVIKYLLKEAVPIAMSSIFVMVYFRVDVILLSWWQNEAAIGDYASAYKLTEAFTMLGGAVVTTLLPVAAKFYNTSELSLARTYELSIKYLGMIMLPVAIGVFFFAGQIIHLFYPSGEYNSALALTVLIWAELFILWNMVLNTFLISMNKQNVAFYITIVLVFINIAANVVLIPLMSFEGAAVATLITEFCFTLSAGLYLYIYQALRWPKAFGRLLAGNLVFALVLSALSGYSLLIVLPIAIVVYLAIVIFGRLIDDSERNLIRFVLTGQRG